MTSILHVGNRKLAISIHHNIYHHSWQILRESLRKSRCTEVTVRVRPSKRTRYLL